MRLRDGRLEAELGGFEDVPSDDVTPYTEVWAEVQGLLQPPERPRAVVLRGLSDVAPLDPLATLSRQGFPRLGFLSERLTLAALPVGVGDLVNLNFYTDRFQADVFDLADHQPSDDVMRKGGPAAVSHVTLNWRPTLHQTHDDAWAARCTGLYLHNTRSELQTLTWTSALRPASLWDIVVGLVPSTATYPKLSSLRLKCTGFTVFDVADVLERQLTKERVPALKRLRIVSAYAALPDAAAVVPSTFFTVDIEEGRRQRS